MKIKIPLFFRVKNMEISIWGVSPKLNDRCQWQNKIVFVQYGIGTSQVLCHQTQGPLCLLDFLF